MIGQTIGNYKILEKSNQTGKIECFKAFDLLLKRPVLLKFLRQELLRQTVADDFRFEAATLAKLSHSGIPTLLALTETDDALFMVQEFTDGETLDKILRRRKKLPFEEAVALFVQILDSLEYSHKSAVAHGCLGISKIVLNDTGIVKILDFGTDSGKIDAGDDIFAVGAMFFEVLTGVSLSDFEKSLESKNNSVAEMRKYLYSVSPFVPEGIKSAIVKATLPNRSGRFQNASEFRDILLTESFDGLGAKDEISISETLLDNKLPFTRLQPVESIDGFGSFGENFPSAKISEKQSDAQTVAVYSVNFSRSDVGIKNEKFNQKPLSADKPTILPGGKRSLSRKSGMTRLMIVSAGILAVIALNFTWQFPLIPRETLQVAETPVKTEKIETPPVEAKPEYEAKNQEVVMPEKNYRPNELPSYGIKPSQTIFRKKAAPETRAERLRRVEKALTGI